jgi:hypothetical protein
MARDVERDQVSDPPRLQSLARAIGAAKAKGPAPVETWNPPFCGDIDLRIARDGTWFYAGTPITRPALVALFASILRRDPDRYVLVTPVECVGITVEDAPFVGVAIGEDGGHLVIQTNLGDEVRVGRDHPLRFVLDDTGGIKPYVHVRGGLWARLTRALALDLLERVETRVCDGVERYGIVSDSVFFALDAALDEAAARSEGPA